MAALEEPRRPKSPHPAPRYTGRTYYGIPPIKHSHYGAKTAAGFFLQGIGSSAQVIATLAELVDRREYRKLIRAGRAMAFLASPGGPLLFVAALHTPRRWYNMLRIFRATSAMSIGIWILTKMALFNALALAGTLLEDRGYKRPGKWMGRVFGLSAGAAGGLVSVYMGSEMEETSTPIWIGASPFLPPLVGATGFSNGMAALSLALSRKGDSREIRTRLQQIATLSSGLQLVFTCLVSRRLRRSVGPSRLQRRAMAVVWPGVLAPLVFRFLDGKSTGESPSPAADVATLAGGAALLSTLLFAGKRSGKVPQDYFRLTSTGQGYEGLPEGRKAKRRRGAVEKGAWAAAALAAGLAAFLLLREGGAAVPRSHGFRGRRVSPGCLRRRPSLPGQ